MHYGDRFYASRKSGVGEVGGFRHGLAAALAGCRNEIWTQCVPQVRNASPGMKLGATLCVDDTFRCTMYDL